MNSSTHTYSEELQDVLVTLPVQPSADNSQYYRITGPRVVGYATPVRTRVDNSLFNMTALISQALREALAITTSTHFAEQEFQDVFEINYPLKTTRIKLKIGSIRQAELQHRLSDFEKWLMDVEV